MSEDLYISLAWLPKAQGDFAAVCKSLATEAAPGQIFRALANQALDENQLTRLGCAINAARKRGASLSPLIPFRLGLIGNGTNDLLVPMLVASAARRGIALECIQGDFAQTTQEALDACGRVNSAKPDAVLLALDHHGFPLRFRVGDAEAEREDIRRALNYLNLIRNGIHDHAGSVCIVQTVPLPPEVLFGSFDNLLPGTQRRLISRLNQAIEDSLLQTTDVILDVAGLAETVGLATWHSPAQWNMAKLACDVSCMPLYADHVSRVIAALCGRSRKCLVLDLDNTLWGGVIGDDGVKGIKIAQGDATGEAHLSIQKFALMLRERGIVLAVSSKNTDEVARIPFREHPEMLLKEEHFAVFQANWNDKATNIKAIASELSLGLDSMVFLDDNPVERELVRRHLPEVAVPELPEDPALYQRTLAAAGYFEATAFSEEDRGRAEMYQSNARRAAIQKQVDGLEEYLASLDMEIQFAPFDPIGRARICQLINKSNQFNLTTRRYSEAGVVAVEQDPSIFSMQIRLVDSFGDNGMISVIICRPGEPGVWEIDTWLMSCRVLGRKVEQMVLREIVARAQEAGVHTLVGTFRPTEKNALVRDHYQNLGFAKVEELTDGCTVWSMSTAVAIPAVRMRVRRAGKSNPAGELCNDGGATIA